MNLLMFSGVCSREPKLFTGKTAFLSFTLKSTRQYNGKEYDSYCDCKLFGPRAIEMDGKIKPGDYVQVYGEAKAEQYEHNGEKKTKLACMCNSVEIVSTAPSSLDRREATPPSPPRNSNQPADPASDTDVPF